MNKCRNGLNTKEGTKNAADADISKEAVCSKVDEFYRENRTRVFLELYRSKLVMEKTDLI